MIKVTILVLTIAAIVDQALSFECGLEGATSRIYRGEKVGSNKYPWMVSMKFKRGNERADCGGVLIDNQHIISVANCYYDAYKGKPAPDAKFAVLLGTTNFNDTKTVMNATYIDIDTKFNRTTLDGDFAIFKLEEPVKFSNTIAPICLPKEDYDPDHKELTILGWGRQASDFGRSQDLKEAQVALIDQYECEKERNSYYTIELFSRGYPRSEISAYLKSGIKPLTARQICAVNKKTGEDACAGDAGGPLMRKNSDGRWVLIGIISGGWAECSTSKHSAGIYSRVVAYNDLIKKIAPTSVFVNLN